MKRFIFILLSNLFFLSVINAQQVTNLTATANNDTIQVSCTLERFSALCNCNIPKTTGLPGMIARPYRGISPTRQAEKKTFIGTV